jgi:hypothetical protein
MLRASNLLLPISAEVMCPSTTCMHVTDFRLCNTAWDPQHTASAATVAGSVEQAESGMTNKAELAMPQHSMQVANAPQSSLQLATMLQQFGSSGGSQMSLFGDT